LGSSESGESTGFSRRDLITRAVAAGGLAWTAPVLLSGPAAAQQQIPCCDEGTPVTVKVAEQTGVNCGVACLSSFANFNFDCPPDLVNCLGDLDFVVGDFTSGGDDTAIIDLAVGVSLIAIGVKAGNNCYFALCPCFASSQTDATCPNVCFLQNGNPCTFGPSETPLPPAPGGLNRIWVVPNSPGPGQTRIFVNTHPDGQLNHVELSLCVAPEVTALCP
jgi:hypothetical protein